MGNVGGGSRPGEGSPGTRHRSVPVGRAPLPAPDGDAATDRETVAQVVLEATIPFRGPGGQTVPYVLPVHYAIVDAILKHLEADHG